MDRLTDRSKEMPTPISDHEAYYARCVNKLADYEDTGLEPLEVDTMNTALCGWCHNYERLVEITNAESEGRLIVLPTDPYEMADVAQEIMSRACRLQREAEAALGGDGDG